jgi:SAM-dependent methyltransferase
MSALPALLSPDGPALNEHFVPRDYELLYEAEPRHFWFRARNELLGAVVEQLVASWSPGYRVLEVGCGTGNVLQVLKQVCRVGHVVGLDLFAAGLRYARQRTDGPLLRADIHSLPFGSSFRLCGMFDVLEHLEDDRAALARLHQVLVPGGRLVLTVPAYMHLWSHTDEYAQHYRRYAPSQLRDRLREGGFTVETLTHFMAPLYPLLWLGRRLARWLPGGTQHSRRELFRQELRLHPLANALLYGLAHCENWAIARGLRLPLGASLLAVASKSA